MKYFTVIGDTYSDALRKATKQYGAKLRVQSMKNVKSGGLFGIGKSAHCELTCYIAEEDNEDEDVKKTETVTPKKDNADLSAERMEEADSGENHNSENIGGGKAQREEDIGYMYRNARNFAQGAVSAGSRRGFSQSSSNWGNGGGGSRTAENAGNAGVFYGSANAGSAGGYAKGAVSGGNAGVFMQGAAGEGGGNANPSFSEALSSGGRSAEDYRLDYYNSIIEKILRQNDFSESYIKWCKDELLGGFITSANVPEMRMEELEFMLFDKISSSFKISHTYQKRPQRNVAVLGTSQSGKTNLVSKLAWVYSLSSQGEAQRNVRIVLADNMNDCRDDAEHYKKLADVLNIGFDAVTNESSLSDALYRRDNDNLFFIDTYGKALSSNEADYKLYALMNVTDAANTSFLLTIPAYMKNSDIEILIHNYSAFAVNMVAITFFDLTGTVGNVISALHSIDKPLVYISDGRVVPKDFEMATSKALLERLKGFSVNIGSILQGA